MARYAATTEVDSTRTRAEIERTLARYGASAFAYGWDGPHALVGFRLGDRSIRYRIPLPDRNADQFRYTAARRRERTRAAQDAEYERAVRQRWRALLLMVKAKLEAIDAGIVTREDAFLAQTVLPDGQTAGEWLRPQIEAAQRTGGMPALLPGLRSDRMLGPGDNGTR
jgi:hypothetical protein